MLSPGATFGRYRIEESLGAGGMGEVYRAFDTVLRRRVALKILRSRREASHTTAEQRQTRLLREARAAAALKHPNVVAVYDVGEIEGTQFIAMELVVGRPLRQHLGDAVPLSRKLRWLADIAAALAAAHDAGLVHRDVKPDNVMVCDDGSIKMLDFGIATRSIEAEPPSSSVEAPLSDLTIEQGRIAGTPRYMAPEQQAGNAVDARADQYAWGVLAFELLCGAHPSDPTREALGVWTTLPDALVRAIHRASAPVAESRHASMRDVSRALEPLLEAPTPPAREGRTPSRAAHGAYLRGRHLWNQRTYDALTRARAHFEEAIRVEPDYADAYVGLADVQLALSNVMDGNDVWVDRASETLSRALELDPTSSSAHASQAIVLARRWRFAEAEQTVRRALELDPTNAVAQTFLGILLKFAWRFDESEAAIRHAIELDPLYTFAQLSLGETLFYAKRYDEAEVELQKTVLLDPGLPHTHTYLAYLRYETGRVDEGLAIYRNDPAASLGGGADGLKLHDVYAAARSGRRANAEAIAREMAASKLWDEQTFLVACAYSLAGCREEMYTALDRAILRHAVRVHYVSVFPAFDAWRDEERFQSLVAKVGLPAKRP